MSALYCWDVWSPNRFGDVNVISTLILGGDATFIINEKSTYFCTTSIIINIDTMLNKCLVPILKFNGFPH